MKFGKQRIVNLTGSCPTILDEMYYGFIYKWTNNANRKKYIGKHKGKINDGYVGEGKLLRAAIRKYGIDNFKRDILEIVYEQKEEILQEKETFWLRFYDAALSNEFYNISATASGGNTTAGYTTEYRSAYMQAIVNTLAWRTKQRANYLKATQTKEWKKKLLEGQKHRRCYTGSNNPKFKGWWVTPYGVFPSQNIAAKESVCSVVALRYRCLNPDAIARNTRHKKEWIGKTWKDNGWYFIPI